MAVVKKFSAVKKVQKHLLGIQNLSIQEATLILDEAKNFIKLNRSASKKLDLLRGKTQINLFFEPSTRTQSSFELAGKRLGADVMTMNVGNSSLKKGETILDTAMSLNAMHPDIIVVRHQDLRSSESSFSEGKLCSYKCRRWIERTPNSSTT